MAAVIEPRLEVTTERLEAEVCTLAGQIAAATCRFATAAQVGSQKLHLAVPVSSSSRTRGGWRVVGDADQSGGLIFLGPRNQRLHEHAPFLGPQRPISTMPDFARIGDGAMTTATGERVQRAAVVDALCAAPRYRHSDAKARDPGPE